jgi:hypothetical protein
VLPHHPLEKDSHQLGATLAPVLAQACSGKLSDIAWFHSTWQHGGAATGFATWRTSTQEIPVLVKFPVGAIEHRWTSELGVCDAESFENSCPHSCTPRVLASGTELGGYDIAWLVIEKLPGHALTHGLTSQDVNDLLAAATDFHESTARCRAPADPPAPPKWDELLEKSREATRKGMVAEAQRWNEAVKKVQKALPVLKARWAARPINTWCHGDLHPGNAIRRSAQSDGSPGRCVLIDLAMVHAGHWVEDGVYLERLYWGRSEQLCGVKPVSTLAKLRRERSLPLESNYSELAALRRVLMAACVPVYAAREGHPKYTHAALETLETTLPTVAK